MTRAQNSTSEPPFHLVVLAGPDEAGRALLRGIYLGAGHAGFLDFTCGDAVEHSLGERLRELVGRRGLVRAVVDEQGLELLRRAEPRLEPETGLRLVETRRVAGARFRFRYRAFAPRYTDEIRSLLAVLPAGLRRTGGEPAETLDPRAKGIEAYSPAHAYEAEGEGEIAGRFDAVLAARTQLSAHPLVEVDDLTLDLG